MLIGKKQEGQKLQEEKNSGRLRQGPITPRRQRLSHGDIFSSTPDLSLESGGQCSEPYLVPYINWFYLVAEVFLKAIFCSYMKVCGLQEEIEISEGWVRGRTLKTLEDQEFLSVEGIPYAEPPVGPLRWMPPTRLLLLLYRSCLYFD